MGPYMAVGLPSGTDESRVGIFYGSMVTNGICTQDTLVIPAYVAWIPNQ